MSSLVVFSLSFHFALLNIVGGPSSMEHFSLAWRKPYPAWASLHRLQLRPGVCSCRVYLHRLWISFRPHPPAALGATLCAMCKSVHVLLGNSLLQRGSLLGCKKLLLCTWSSSCSTSAWTLRPAGLLSLTFLTPLSQSYLREYLLVSSLSSSGCTGDNWNCPQLTWVRCFSPSAIESLPCASQLLIVCENSDKTSDSTEDFSLLSSLEGSHFSILPNTGGRSQLPAMEISLPFWISEGTSHLLRLSALSQVLPFQRRGIFGGIVSHCGRWVFGAMSVRSWLLCKALFHVKGQHLSDAQFGAISQLHSTYELSQL